MECIGFIEKQAEGGGMIIYLATGLTAEGQPFYNYIMVTEQRWQALQSATQEAISEIAHEGVVLASGNGSTPDAQTRSAVAAIAQALGNTA